MRRSPATGASRSGSTSATRRPTACRGCCTRERCWSGSVPANGSARRPSIRCPARSRPATCSVRRWPCPSPTSTAPTTSCCSGPTRTPRTAACAPHPTFPAASRPSGRGAARSWWSTPAGRRPPRRPTSGCRSVRAPTPCCWPRSPTCWPPTGRAALASTSSDISPVSTSSSPRSHRSRPSGWRWRPVSVRTRFAGWPARSRRRPPLRCTDASAPPRPSSGRPRRGWSTPSTS